MEGRGVLAEGFERVKGGVVWGGGDAVSIPSISPSLPSGGCLPVTQSQSRLVNSSQRTHPTKRNHRRTWAATWERGRYETERSSQVRVKGRASMKFLTVQVRLSWEIITACPGKFVCVGGGGGEVVVRGPV